MGSFRGRDEHVAALERQRHWLLRALNAREAVRALVIQWRRQPGRWQGARRDLGLDKLTPRALCRTATPEWRSTVVADAASGGAEMVRPQNLSKLDLSKLTNTKLIEAQNLTKLVYY
jgi:hypothetical protein